MVKEICKDTGFLSQPSQEAGPEDLETAQDLLDTLPVGLAVDFLGNMGYTVFVYTWSYAPIGCFAMINLENSAFLRERTISWRKK